MSMLLNAVLALVVFAGVLWLLSPRLSPSVGKFLVKMDMTSRLKKAGLTQKSFVLPDGRGAWYLERPGNGHSDKKPLVVLPGLSVSMHLMGAQIADLLTHLPERRVIVIELPYHGQRVSPRSDFNDPGLALNALTESVAAVVDNIGGLESFDLMGYSLGGVLATNVALKHPGRVNKLVLLAPYYFNEATTDAYNATFDAGRWRHLAAWQGRDELESWFYNWLGLIKSDAPPGFIFNGLAALRSEQYPEEYWVGFYQQLDRDCRSSTTFLADNGVALRGLQSDVLLLAASDDTICDASKLTQLSEVFNPDRCTIETVNAGHFFAPKGRTLFEESAAQIGSFLSH